MSSTRERVVARYVAKGVYACMAGDSVGLHILTEDGRVFINVPVRRYRELCLADRDANGRTWPVFHDHSNDTTPEHVFINFKHPRGELSPFLEAAWNEWKSNPSETLLSLGHRLGLTASALSTHFNKRHADEYRQLSKDRPRQGVIRTAETQAKIEAAFQEYRYGVAVKQLAAKYSVSSAVLYSEFKTLRRIADATADRQPILKPTGTIL